MHAINLARSPNRGKADPARFGVKPIAIADAVRRD